LQLLSPSNFSRLLPSPANESSSSSSLHSAVPHLRELQLDRIVGSSSDWELLRHHTKLETISIEFCDDLTQVPESIRSLTSLQVLYIIGCPALGALPEWLGELCSLRDLEIRSDNLKMLPDAIQHLTSLESLQLICCRALVELPEGIGQLSALRRLDINGCSALQCLPQSIQHLTALQSLDICYCPALASRYKQGGLGGWRPSVLPPKTCMRANAAAPNPVVRCNSNIFELCVITEEIMMVLQCALQGLAGRYKQGVGPDRHLCLPHPS